MQKRGFTLAEILISVGIVGVIAAIMLPMVNKFKPDENKIKFLQTYNSLVEIMPSIVNNRLAYPIMNDGEDDIYDKSPLLNTKAPFVIDGETFKGTKKFCHLLATGFNTVGDINCSEKYESLEELMKKTPSFTTANGVQFFVQTKIDTTKEDEAEYSSEIYLDVNGADGENCFSNVDTCKDPDRFMLKVGADGTIEVVDTQAQQHLETRANWKKNRDLKVEVANLDTSTMAAETEKLPEDNSKGDTVTPPTIGDGNGGDGTLPDIPDLPDYDDGNDNNDEEEDKKEDKDDPPPPPPPPTDPMDMNFIVNMYSPELIVETGLRKDPDAVAAELAVLSQQYMSGYDSKLYGVVPIKAGDTVGDVLAKLDALPGVDAEYVTWDYPYPGRGIVVTTTDQWGNKSSLRVVGSANVNNQNFGSQSYTGNNDTILLYPEPQSQSLEEAVSSGSFNTR